MRWNRGLVGLGVVLVGSVAGCSSAHEAGSDAGTLPGDSAVQPDSGTGEACGATICGPGLVCCNASCGICTPPGGSCIDLFCTDVDAGPGPRSCGGFGGLPCGPSEFCDYPDGSFCGGDDSTGVCTPRPTDCPEPGGVPTCGCDGVTYIGECSAYFSGTDVAHTGECAPTPVNGVSATATCGPADGPAWTFVITDGAPLCGGVPTGSSLSISVWDSLETATPGRTYRIGGDFAVAEGDASSCPAGGGGPPCFTLTGTFTLESFTPSGGAIFSYDLFAFDGSRVAASHGSVGTWCPRARLCG